MSSDLIETAMLALQVPESADDDPIVIFANAEAKLLTKGLSPSKLVSNLEQAGIMNKTKETLKFHDPSKVGKVQEKFTVKLQESRETIHNIQILTYSATKALIVISEKSLKPDFHVSYEEEAKI